ncbi:MAG: zinc-ribbon domain-containing protein [Wolbachia endosymbiont of Tyrophagus putrescentiae]|nr:zinc-ribbon domain-containing protein [Wolbachia endosymbiont of Tyrophagus putrescentiae]
MKIQCKNCTKVYLVPEDQIGKSGRKVKCTSCHYIWYEYPQVAINRQEKKSGLWKNLALACIMFVAISAVIVDPNEVQRLYNKYKDSMHYKLSGHKKEPESNYHIKINANNEDYLFPYHLKHSSHIN